MQFSFNVNQRHTATWLLYNADADVFLAYMVHLFHTISAQASLSVHGVVWELHTVLLSGESPESYDLPDLMPLQAKVYLAHVL